MSHRSATALQRCLLRNPASFARRGPCCLLWLEGYRQPYELFPGSGYDQFRCNVSELKRQFTSVPWSEDVTYGAVEEITTEDQSKSEAAAAINRQDVNTLTTLPPDGDVAVDPYNAVETRERDGLGAEHGQTKAGDAASVEEVLKAVNVIRRSRTDAEQAERATAVIKWQTLYKRLSFPEDRDLSNAKDAMSYERALASSFIGNGVLEEVTHRWNQLQHNTNTLTPSILAGCLAESANHALTALSIMTDIPGGWRTRADCLYYLRRVYRTELETDHEVRDLFDRQLAVLRDPKSWPRFRLASIHLDMLLHGLPKEQTSQLVHEFLQRYPFEGTASLLYVVDCFIRIGDVDSALSVLRRLPQHEIQRGSQALLERCMNLLTLDTVHSVGSTQNFKILSTLIELGLPPDDLIHNMALQNAIRQNQPGVAWDLFRYMKSSNFEVNSRSHLTLLKDSFLRQDVQGLNEVMSAIHEREDLAQNPYLVAYTMNIVRIAYYFERKADAQESLSHLLAVYDRAYDRAPLVKLGIVRSGSRFPKTRSLSKPGPIGLAFTIWSFVLVQRQERHVSRLWDELSRLIKQKDPEILEAAKYDAFYSGFIIFFSRHHRHLSKGVRVLQSMLELNLCQPRDSTWGVVICMFLKHGQDESAERIRKLMQSRGVEVTEDSWKFILQRYPDTEVAAKIQSILDARTTLGELDEAMWEDGGRESAEGKATGVVSREVQKGWADMERWDDFVIAQPGPCASGPAAGSDGKTTKSKK